MLFKSIITSVLVLVFLSIASGTAPADQKDRDAQLKLSLDELKAEIIVLERQVRTMQETMDKNGGQLSTLITQIVDNVNAIRQAQSRVAEGSSSAIQSVSGLGEKITDTNQRIDRVSEQLAQLRKLVENLPKLPTFAQITPGNPDQLFAAAYGDYSRGNYDLALSEFRQYVETYPTSEMADKVPAARFKKAMALMELGQTDASRAELTAIIKLYPRSNEAVLAKQQLER